MNFSQRDFLLRFLAMHDELSPNYTRENVNVKCPECSGSSTKNERKGYFLFNNEQINYYCHKGGCEFNKARSLNNFLRMMYPTDYLSFQEEVQFGRRESEQKIDYSSLITQKAPSNEKKNTESFMPIRSQSRYSEAAVKYCTERFIPEEVWKNWYVAERGKYFGRVIIPFRNAKGKIEYYQGRSLIGSEPKYLNKIGNKKVYNRDFVDPDKMVFAFEGVIDSLHAENSIAVLGLGDKILVEGVEAQFKNLCFVLDDDEVGRGKMADIMRDGKRVFLWGKFKSDLGIPSAKKWDFNKIVCEVFGKEHIFPNEQLSKYVSQSYFDKILL